MEVKNERIKEIVDKYTEQELLEALVIKSGYNIKKLGAILEQFGIEDIKKVDDKTYSTTNGIINKLNTFKDKRALVGDYTNASFYNTKMVLDSLGFEIVQEKTATGMYERIASGEKFDIIFTNNIYQSGGTGPELLQKLKEIKDFNIPVIIHTISEQPIEYFLKLGFDGCLKKPITQNDTIELLNKIL